MIIEATNPSLENLEKTTLASPISAGATSSTVKNNQGFANTDRILIGDYARERSEIVSINASVTAGTTISHTATVFNHNTDDPIYKLKFDQVRFYRSTTGVAGTYSLLATQALDVDNAEMQTVYDDTMGVSSYYYKISYYNSITTVESQLSDPIPGAGFSRNTVGAAFDEVQREVGDPNMVQTSRPEWIDWCNEVNDDIITRSRKPLDFLLKATAVDATAGTDIPYPADMWKFDRLDYTYAIGGISQTYEVRTLIPEEMRNLRYNNNAVPSDRLEFIALDEVSKTIQTYPVFATTRAGVISIRYYKGFTDITSEAQVFETPNPRVYKMYLLGRFYRKKAQADQNFLNLANQYMNEYNQEIIKLQRTQGKDVGSPRSFSFSPQTLKGFRRY